MRTLLLLAAVVLAASLNNFSEDYTSQVVINFVNVGFLGQRRSGDARVDAEMVGDRVLDLVKRLGLDSDLGGFAVGREEIPVIVKRATGLESGPVYEAVEELVSRLFV